MEKLKVAVIGGGNRGGSMCSLVAKMKDISILSVCDAYEDRAERLGKIVKRHRHKAKVFTDYKEAIAVEGVQAVFIFTSWESHVEIAVASMKLGKDVGMEVGGAYNLEECYELVRVAEETGRQCMMLENCCYGRYELMTKRLVDEGKLGTIVHCEGGYCHDLRQEVAEGTKNRHYRWRNYTTRNCENYPTHELGPIAKILHINDGNRFTTLTSMASKASSLHEYIMEKYPKEKELQETVITQGDVVTTTIMCENGETIVLSLKTTTPQFYTRRFSVFGTKGLYQEDGDILYMDGPKAKHWLPKKCFYKSANKNVKKYEHPIWQYFRKHKQGGHGGMDYLVLRAFVESILQNRKVPIDVYDTVSWMAITPLSEISIQNGSTAVEVPDFTHGMYKNRTDKNGGKYDLA